MVTLTESPSVVSNTYNGLVTLQISGLTNGVTNVLVQKFLDVNTNGVIDSGDLLVQQFRLSAGELNVFTDVATHASVTVTNFMPGDTSAATNQMTIPLNFQNGDFAQTLVGRYLYKVSSPSLANGFAPVTNLFAVTNAYFSSLVTGAVVNASSSPNYTNVPHAIVLLCLNQNGAINVQAGTVANSGGLFSLRAPPGNYFMAAAMSNFVEDVLGEEITITGPSTNSISVGLTPATSVITGRIINSATSNGLAGVSGVALSTNNLLSFYFTDTNGNFNAPVTTNSWEAPVDAFAAAFQGCLAWQTNVTLNVSNKTVNFTNALPPATAIFYGTVSNSSAVPMAGVYLYANDNAGHQSVGMTDSHGKYVVGVSGTNEWQLSILWPNNPGLSTEYAFAPGSFQTNGLEPGQAVHQNFTLIEAPYHISGTVRDYDGNPIAGVEVFATNGIYEAASAITGPDGSYSLNVAPGAWTVGLDAASLADLGLTNVPPDQIVTISGSDVTGVNFLIEICGEVDILTTNLPDAFVGKPYEAQLQADSCQNISSWSTAFGVTLTSLYDQTNIVYTNGTPIYSDSKLIGYIETAFGVSNVNNQAYMYNCSGTAEVDHNNAQEYQFFNVSATVNVTAPIASNMTVTINGKSWGASATTLNGSIYSTTLTIGELPDPYDGYYETQGWNATLGTPITTSGPGSNTVALLLGPFHSVPTAQNSTVAASSIPYTNLDNLVVFIQQGKHVGQYVIAAHGPQSTNLPPGLTLFPDGTLAGTPTATSTNGVFNFSVMAEDTASNLTVQPVSMFVFPATTITGPGSSQAGALQASNTFQMQVGAVAAGLNYTVLMSTNLVSGAWVPIYATNAVNTNAFNVPDTSATNAARFYRIEISQ
ncbi:MAG: carboxypeptidase-like regulatory domain-containing protein [Limisphaerales bacterium]